MERFWIFARNQFLALGVMICIIGIFSSVISGGYVEQVREENKELVQQMEFYFLFYGLSIGVILIVLWYVSLNKKLDETKKEL